LALYPLPLVLACSLNLNVSVQSARLNRQLQISHLLNYIFLSTVFVVSAGGFVRWVTFPWRTQPLHAGSHFILSRLQ